MMESVPSIQLKSRDAAHGRPLTVNLQSFVDNEIRDNLVCGVHFFEGLSVDSLRSSHTIEA